MSVTILEALQNAEYNLNNATFALQIEMGKRQLSNAVALLEKGYQLNDEVEPLLEEFGSVDNVPEAKI